MCHAMKMNFPNLLSPTSRFTPTLMESGVVMETAGSNQDTQEIIVSSVVFCHAKIIGVVTQLFDMLVIERTRLIKSSLLCR